MHDRKCVKISTTDIISIAEEKSPLLLSLMVFDHWLYIHYKFDSQYGSDRLWNMSIGIKFLVPDEIETFAMFKVLGPSEPHQTCHKVISVANYLALA